MVSPSKALSVPVALPDGTIMAQVAAPCDEWGRLRLRVPTGSTHPHDIMAGRYLLARCATAAGTERGDEWGIYLRRPLFFCGRRLLDDQEEWCLFVPVQSYDPGYQWLAALPKDAMINAIGPLGNGFQIQSGSHNLLLLADLNDNPAWLPWLMPLIEPILDQGGRVTLLVYTSQPLPTGLLDTLPTALEVRTLYNANEWQAALSETLRWADQVCAGIPAAAYSALYQNIRTGRFHITEGFAQVLVRVDLLCGVGACLACVIPTPGGGFTRACVHGPVFDLAQLVV
jgi:dihydroorotate dehydrogenase electron transfer subunit